MSIAQSPSLRLGLHREAGPVVRLPIGALGNGRSVRVNGVNAAHVRRLAGVAERKLPPIVVQQNTMRVADGLHRFRAARLRGVSHVSVRFLDCDDLDAFVFALLANNEPGGLPLTRADRRSAAEHILSVRPQWSDRRLAAVTGVAPRTVAEARDRLGSRAEVRVGMDGRIRPTVHRGASAFASCFWISRTCHCVRRPGWPVSRQRPCVLYARACMSAKESSRPRPSTSSRQIARPGVPHRLRS